ncbi:CD209 antigen-like protein B [Trichomycterus rosablanca]|uniref:CD209 antigen-like protein B n=1 Tax=Trichomycterus rosablanca TaxID=2290929 RepID=UPI002F35C1D4
MENIYSNTDFKLSNMNIEGECSDFAESGNGDDDYENVEEMDGRPTASIHTDVSNCAEWKIKEKEYTSSKRKVKSLMATLILLLLGALTALSFLTVLYFSESVSHDRVSEQYTNATALLKMQENETTELKSSLDKVQESYEGASKQREELRSNLEKVQVSYEAASKQLDSLKAKERVYKQLEEKYQRIHEVLSKAKKSCDLCDEGWRSLGLKCYFFSTNNLNWMASRDSCVEKGGHLVIITNQAEQDFLSLNIKETHWMGLNDLEMEGKWMWVNDKTLDETGVKFWLETNPSEPDNWRNEDPSGENCACLGNEAGSFDRWFDASCRKVKKYICEK